MGIEIIAIIAILFLLAVVFIAFTMLKKTIKMAIRMIIVAIVLFVTIIGSIALWVFFSGNETTPNRPNATKQK